MRLLMKEGRDAFYKGPFMEAMVLAIRADGGLLTEEDFLSHRSDWVEPLSTTYKGDRIYQMPPNSQGFSLLLMMNILEHFDLAGIPRDSAAFYHLMVEVVKKAFQYRDRYLTDPDFAHIPVDQLLSKDFARQLSEQITLTPMEASPFLSSPMGQDTAYAAVVDDEGNAVSFIQSLYYDFGSAYVPEGTGVILQNRGSFFFAGCRAPQRLASEQTHLSYVDAGDGAARGKAILITWNPGRRRAAANTVIHIDRCFGLWLHDSRSDRFAALGVWADLGSSERFAENGKPEFAIGRGEAHAVGASRGTRVRLGRYSRPGPRNLYRYERGYVRRRRSPRRWSCHRLVKFGNERNEGAG